MYRSILNLKVFSQPLSVAVCTISLPIRPIRHSHSIQSPESSVSVSTPLFEESFHYSAFEAGFRIFLYSALRLIVVRGDLWHEKQEKQVLW